MKLAKTDTVTNNAIGMVAALCQDKGCRFSVKKKEVLIGLSYINDFADAETLWMVLLENNMRTSLASVYLVLKWMVKNNIAEKKLNNQRRCFYRLTIHN